jgi:hypothetical protein
MFYNWSARGRDINEPPVAQGVVNSLRDGQLAAGKFVLDGRALVAMVAECWPSGEAWYGMANLAGGITWRQRVTA